MPLAWSETKNVAWKTDIRGLGWSSPSIVAGRIWITTAVKPDARLPRDGLLAICLDAASGDILKTVNVFHKDDPGSIHGKNSMRHRRPSLKETASTSITAGMARRAFPPTATSCGRRSSNTITATVRRLASDLQGSAHHRLRRHRYAVRHRAGQTHRQEVWKTPRVEGRMAYSTPTLTVFDGQPQLITAGGEFFSAYDSETGKELWRFRYPGGYSNVPRPVVSHGLAFASSGYNDTHFPPSNSAVPAT